MMSHFRRILIGFLLLVAFEQAIDRTNELAMAQTPEGRTVYSIDPDVQAKYPSANAITIDVLWCGAEDQASSDRRLAAAAFAGSVSTFARITNAGLGPADKPDSIVRTVRLREMLVGGDLQIRGPDTGNAFLLPDSRDETYRLAQLIVGASGTNVRIEQSRDPIPNYMQVIICEGANLTRAPSRVFIQASRKDQEPVAMEMIANIRSDMRNVNVATGIEFIGDHSPSQTEIRYYHRRDQPLAEKLAEKIKSIDAAPVIVLSNNQGSVREGTIEISLSRELAAQSKTTYYVCEGQYQNRCPPKSQWISCYTPLELWAQSRPDCASIKTKRRLSSVGGNRCGYTVTEVICSN